jgi:hypothetical protein
LIPCRSVSLACDLSENLRACGHRAMVTVGHSGAGVMTDTAFGWPHALECFGCAQARLCPLCGYPNVGVCRRCR